MNWYPTAEQLERITGASDIEQLESIGGFGRLNNLQDSPYRKSGGVSQSFLKKMEPTPAHACVEQEDKPHFRIGRHVHQAVLTPHDPLPEFAVYPETYTGDKGEQKPWNMNANACKAWVAQQMELGRIAMPRKEYDVTTGCIRSIAENHYAKEIFKAGDAEVSLFRAMEINGVKFIMKSRIDWAPSNYRFLVDIKTVQRGESDYRNFVRKIQYEGYGEQARHYTTNWNFCNPDDQRDSFLFVVVEKGEPFVVQFYRMSMDAIARFSGVVEKRLELFASCVREGVFPGDVNAIQEVVL